MAAAVLALQMRGISLAEGLGVVFPAFLPARAGERVRLYPTENLLPVLLGRNADPTFFDVGDRHRSARLQRGRRALPCPNFDPPGGYEPVPRFELDILAARRLSR